MKQALDSIPEQQVCLQEQVSSPEMPADSKDRLDYLSNLKVFLTALVILHHTAIAYGGTGQLPYHAPSHPPGSDMTLVTFNAINQTYFMALFFFIAGFLSRRSLVRRVARSDVAGLGGFVKERLWRLGLPTAVYSLLGPVACHLIIVIDRGEDITWEDVWGQVSSIRGVRGPVWFCALLLIFDVFLAAFWTLKETLWRDSASNDRIILPENDAISAKLHSATISGLRLSTALCLLTAIDFSWRILFPVGEIFALLNLNLGYLPQYIATYTFGLMVSDPTYALPRSRALLGPGVASTIGGVILMRTVSARLDLDGEQDPAVGGFNALAASYAIWNNCTGYVIGSGSLCLFHQHINTPWKAVSSLAYTVFLLHIPVSMIIEVLLEEWSLEPVPKTILIGSMNIFASWSVSWVWEAVGSMLRSAVKAKPADAVQRHNTTSRQTPLRKRTLSRGERAIEILEGLDEVGR